MPQITELGVESGRHKPQTQRGNRDRLANCTRPPPPAPVLLRKKAKCPTTAHKAPKALPVMSSPSALCSSNRGLLAAPQTHPHPPTLRSLCWLVLGLELSFAMASLRPSGFCSKVTLPARAPSNVSAGNEEPTRTMERISETGDIQESNRPGSQTIKGFEGAVCGPPSEVADRADNMGFIGRACMHVHTCGRVGARKLVTKA